MATTWGARRLDDITATDIEAMKHTLTVRAVARRNGRGGRCAGEHLVAATRAVYTRAIADGLLTPGTSPADRVAVPRRLPNIRAH